MKLRKVLIFVISCVMISSLVLSGCANNNSTDTATSTTKTSTTANTATTTTQTVETTKAAPDEISFFYGTAGLKGPEGTKLDDNVYLNKIAELANVTFSEVIVPEYADFQTKFNLMISSGNIPDLVHCWFAADVQLQGKAGAFLELGDIIKNSPVLSAKYPANTLNLMENDDGNIYALRTIPGVDTQACGIRYDVLDDVNGGVVPVTPDEWYQAFKNLKAKYPDSVPYSSNGGMSAFQLFFKAYGVNFSQNGAEWQYKDGKVISSFEAPFAKDSILYHKKLYDEGLLDQTFVTNKSADFLDRKSNKKLLIAPNNLNSVLNYIGWYISNNVEGTIFAPGPLPRLDDARVTDDDVYTANGLLGYHCVAIGGATKQQDAAVRLIETLLSDEVMELTSWGIKDVDYTVVNGQNAATEAGSATLGLRKMYGFMYTYGSAKNVEVSLADQLAKIVDTSVKDKYTTLIKDGMALSYNEQAKASQNPLSYLQLSTDSQSQVKEAYELSKSIIIKAIIGEITMDQYDKEVSDYITKYQFITDEYNSKLPAMMEKLK